MSFKHKTIHRWIENRGIFIFLCVYFLICNSPMFSEPASVIVNEIDGSEMVLIPSGTYLIGSTSAQTTALINKDARLAEDFFEAEHPQHTVSLSPFYIDRYPVSNAQYAAFIAATNHPTPKYWKECTTNGRRKTISCRC